MRNRLVRQLAMAAFAVFATAAHSPAEAAANTPATILHVVTVQWKVDSTPAQQQAAIDGIRKMAAEIPGIRNIWVRKVKVQPAEFHTVFAIEFENKAAFDVYTNHPSHKAWEKIYLPIREESQTQDLTN